ncbi:uncharacterized protein LOC130736430 [Lotus japonicus]|uniref:uncharacterized protein LOC130736430 n=1 Tax=Lotus japonicus TaxID=34305 RepID=UPI00258D4BBB|nr:uncharacterized protein LOC130736430 [Lotus japonicus]
MKTILKVGKCYERLLKEFLVNLSVEVGLRESVEFRKFYVRAKCVAFSLSVIHKALGRNADEFVDEELSLDVIVKELIAGQVKKWSFKKFLSTGNLSVKYAILDRNGAVNWVPTQHNSGVSTTLAKLIYKIGTSTDFDFGSFVFEQTMKNVDTCAVKLPHPQIIKADEVAMPKGVPITWIIACSWSRMSQTLLCHLAGHLPLPLMSLRLCRRLSRSALLGTYRVDVFLLKVQEEEGQGVEPSVVATATQDESTEEEGGSEESAEETEEESSSED